MNLTKKDFKIDWFSGTGAGGQHRNRHQNCVRITHIQSGLTTTGQEHKSAQRNFKDAFTRLAHMVYSYYHPIEEKQRAPETEVVRSYNIPDNRVVDHTSKLKTSWKNLDLNEHIISRKSVK